MMTATRDIAAEFKEFEKENGPSFCWGKLSSPYDGCFYLHALAFIQGNYAFVAADLKSFTGGHRGTDYASLVVPPPTRIVEVNHERIRLSKLKEITAGCVKVENLEEVLGDRIEFHPIKELPENTPYQVIRQVLVILAALNQPWQGLFKCNACGGDLFPGEELFYLESEFKGNGGVGIEVGAPICSDCFSLRKCAQCGAEVEPYQNYIDEEGDFCVCCAPAKICPVSKLVVAVEWDSDQETVTAYRRGVHPDAVLAEEFAKSYEDNVTGSLF